ncbi:MAG: FAD-dependent monooxygenase, partial [Mariprofundaceae bacterium]|nr:FAD-dependent monooxygenase [Mariprofundaceae bacterium]
MTQILHEFDAVIVGGGAVGGIQALALANLGYRVAIIEQNMACMASSNPERVVALSYGTRCYLQDLGLWNAIAAQGTGNIRFIDVRESNNHGEMSMQAAEKHVDALGYVVELSHVVAAVYAALPDKVTMFCPAKVTQMHHDDDAVHLSMHYKNQSHELHAKLLIAADGTHSQMRRMAGITTHGWDHNRFGLVATIRCERDHADTAYECFRQSGPLACLPLADGRFSIVWALAPQDAMRMLDMPDRMFLNRLQRAVDEAVLPRSGRMLEVSKRACFPLELRIAQSFTAPRMALIGNAAHTLHPVAGQGLNLGLRDVACLTNILKHAHVKNDMSDIGSTMLLQRYAEQRRLDVWAVAGFTESILAGFESNIAPLKWLRGQALDGMQRI